MISFLWLFFLSPPHFPRLNSKSEIQSLLNGIGSFIIYRFLAEIFPPIGVLDPIGSVLYTEQPWDPLFPAPFWWRNATTRRLHWAVHGLYSALVRDPARLIIVPLSCWERAGFLDFRVFSHSSSDFGRNDNFCVLDQQYTFLWWIGYSYKCTKYTNLIPLKPLLKAYQSNLPVYSILKIKLTRTANKKPEIHT